MAHQFSVEIHNFLTDMAIQCEKELQDESLSIEKRAYFKGRGEELNFLRDVMSQKFDLHGHNYYHDKNDGK